RKAPAALPRRWRPPGSSLRPRSPPTSSRRLSARRREAEHRPPRLRANSSADPPLARHPHEAASRDAVSRAHVPGGHWTAGATAGSVTLFVTVTLAAFRSTIGRNTVPARPGMLIRLLRTIPPVVRPPPQAPTTTPCAPPHPVIELLPISKADV